MTSILNQAILKNEHHIAAVIVAYYELNLNETIIKNLVKQRALRLLLYKYLLSNLIAISGASRETFWASVRPERQC